MSDNQLALCEYQPQQCRLSPATAQLLARDFADRISITPLLGQPDYYQLRASHYVGIIVLPELQLIIKPKMPVNNLLHMLARVYQLAEWPTTLANVALADWCEILLIHFVESVDQLLRAGLLRGYHEIDDRVVAIRGQLQFDRQLQQQFNQPGKHQCRFDEQSINILENSLIKLALYQARTLPINDHNLLRRCQQINSSFNDVELLPLAAGNSVDAGQWFDQLAFSRLNQHYHRPLMLARLIIELAGPSLTVGNRLAPAFLIDINRLYERYVAQQLTETINNSNRGLTIRLQMRDHLDEQRALTIVPDIVIIQAGQPKLIIDTKYKWSSEATDYYQMIAYCLALNSKQARLAYPDWAKAISPARIKNSNIEIAAAPVQLMADLATLTCSINALLAGIEVN